MRPLQHEKSALGQKVAGLGLRLSSAQEDADLGVAAQAEQRLAAASGPNSDGGGGDTHYLLQQLEKERARVLELEDELMLTNATIN